MNNQESEEEFDMPSGPYWIDAEHRCSYRSVIGVELGYVERPRLGEPTWFSHLKNTEEPIFPRGIPELEEAKKLVEEYSEINLEFENEFMLEQQKRRGRRR